MIDLHTHLIPNHDDGAADWNESLAMARVAVEQGIVQCAATPHWGGAPDEGDRIREKLAELRRRLEAEKIALRVHAGHEVVLEPRLLDALRSNNALALGESNYVLLETAQLQQGAYVHQALFQIQTGGFRIILAHPERMRHWQTDLKELRELVSRGCFLQVNAGSLLGAFGRSAQRMAEDLLELRWVALLASDAHGVTNRPFLLRGAYERCKDLIGSPRANALVDENPARVLCNDQIPYPDADATLRRRAFAFPWWSKR